MAQQTAAVLGEVIRVAAGSGAACDRELLERFAAGEQAAFAALFRRHGGMVLGVCHRALPRLQDAEDACQATFLLLARKAASGRWQPSVANWLYLTARRVAGNARRSADRRARHERKAAVAEAVQPVDRMTARELLQALDAELDRLPASYREPLVLCYLEGLTRDEAAARLGLRPATLKSRLERGRKRLGDALTRRGCVAGAGLLALAATSKAEAASGMAEGVLAAAFGRAPAPVAALAEGVAANVLVCKSVVAVLLLIGSAALGLGWISAGLPAERAPYRPAVSADRPGAKQPPGGEMPAPGAKPAEKSAAVGRPAARTITGRVLGPDGKAVGGVKLFVPAVKSAPLLTPDDITVRQVGTTDADGRFRAAVEPLHKSAPRAYLIAYLPGFGVDWLQFGGPGDPELVGEQTLRLPKDLPISGRVVNTEGRPVPGVSVAIETVNVPADEKLDEYLAGWFRNLRDNLATPRKRLYFPLDRITGPTTTDRDGRFTVRGAGAERIVYLRMDGGGIARSVPYVVTRAGFDPGPYNEELRKREHDALRELNRFLGLYGPDLTFIAEGGKEITGLVSDLDTGEPIAGCRMFTLTGFGDGVLCRTDSHGHYRLSGIPKRGSQVRISVTPPDGSRYLARTEDAADTEGLAPVRLNVRMAKGAMVTGRVIDRQTGKGVRTGIRFAPLPANKLFGTRPEYSAYATDRTMRDTDADGSFRLLTIPGPALAMAQVHEGETYNGKHVSPYRNATPDPEHKDLFRRYGESWTVTTAGNSLEFLSNEHAVKVVDVGASGETRVDLYVDRGVTAKLTVQDAAGRPLAGAWVAGLTDHWPITYRLTEPTATVYALDPAKHRTLVLYHPDRGLGGTVTVRGDEKEPVVAKLQPLARVTGRLLDADGQPLGGLLVWLAHPRQIDSELYRFAAPAGARTVTDKAGRFTLDAVVPGVRTDLQIVKGREFYNSRPRLPQFRLKPGENFDLGDRRLAPQPSP